MKKSVPILPIAMFVCMSVPQISAQTSPGAAGSDEARKLNAQAVALYREGKYEGAIKLQKQAVAMWEKELGKEHKLIAKGSISLGEMYQALKRYDEAADAYRRALKIEEKLLGPEHPDLFDLVTKLGWMHHGNAQAGEAEALFKRAVAIREKEGIAPVRVIGPLLTLATFYQKIGRPAASLPIYQRVIAVEEKHFGPEGQLLVDTLEKFSCALRQSNKLLEASEVEQRAALIERKARPDVTLVSGGVLQGRAINKVQPHYPLPALAQRLSGSVFIQVEIDETGVVTKAKILCGADLLVGVSREAALKWRFEPVILDGKPIKVKGVLTFNFTL
jgi:TonB family protein